MNIDQFSAGQVMTFVLLAILSMASIVVPMIVVKKMKAGKPDPKSIAMIVSPLVALAAVLFLIPR